MDRWLRVVLILGCVARLAVVVAHRAACR